MISDSELISAELDARLVVSEKATVPVRMALRYQAGDPYAVHAVFHLGDDGTVDWCFARELLAEGLHRSAGFGDVRIRPTPVRGPYSLSVALTSPMGRALLVVPAQPVAAFLQQTEAAVPPGTERCRFDLDAELALILADG